MDPNSRVYTQIFQRNVWVWEASFAQKILSPRSWGACLLDLILEWALREKARE